MDLVLESVSFSSHMPSFFGHQPLDTFVTALKQSSKHGKLSTVVPKTKEIMAILSLLQDSGLILSWKENEKKPDSLIVFLKYTGMESTPVLINLKRVSKSSKKVYLSAQTLDKNPKTGWNYHILRTDRGILLHTQAWKANLGGEHLLKINTVE